MPDILEILDETISDDKPKTWSKLASTVTYRRLELVLLREILTELRKIESLLPEKKE